MASTKSNSAPHRTWDSPLGWLGHRLAHHPWHAVVLWVAIIAICLLPASDVGAVISGTFSNPLPSQDESVQAANEMTAEFPHAAASPSSAIILLEAPDVTGPVGKNATMALTAELTTDKTLKNVSSVESLYVAYTAYLAGEAELGWGFLTPALTGTPSLTTSVGETATLVWAPAAAYVGVFESRVHQGDSFSNASAAAFAQTQEEFASSPLELSVLHAFLGGTGGFNASVAAGCPRTENASICGNVALESTLPALLPTLFPTEAELLPALLVLGDLDLENWTQPASQEAPGAALLGSEVGIGPAWLLTIWRAFPNTTAPGAAALFGWAALQVETEPTGHWPLPVPSELSSSFVNPGDSATLIIVAFNDPDTHLVNGSSVNYADVAEIDKDVSNVLGASPAFAGITAYETGSAPLDSATNYLATSALSLLLVLTIVVLLVIMLLYFRAPAAPALAFGMIGIALVASFAGIFLVGTFVTKFNAEIESIILVFLMSIGTDYSVFLLARYREELVSGADPKRAVETTVRWAGQSIATSGLAVMVVAMALTLSGISFLSELGICLLLAVLFALLVNLTVLPSVLSLVGPRIFWPNSGERFARYAKRRTHNIETNRDYIARAGRAATRRPVLVIGLILLLSAPVVLVALEVPVSYDITNIGLPSGNSAQVGFVQLDHDFGESYFSPSDVLVTLSQPLFSAGAPNAQEFEDLAGLSDTINSTAGVSGVSGLVGAGGAPLSVWLNFTLLPPAVKIGLNETLASGVGVDGKTVLFNVQTNASGYSAAAISVLDQVQQRVGTYDASHPGVSKVYYGGAAPTTQDIRSLVSQATEEMLIGAALGLLLLMLLILGSAFVPVLALGVIGLSILWSWAATYFVVGIVEGEALIFLLPLILLILVLGLGMDYNVLLLTRVKEERTLGNRGVGAIQDAVTHAGGVITAAAVILGGAFLLLGFTSPLGLLAAIGLGIGFAVLLQAFVVQLFFTPAVLALGKDAIWKGWSRRSSGEGASPPEPQRPSG